MIQCHVTGRVRVEVCPNLLQRPGSSRGSREEPLIFRAFIRHFSRPGTPLQQIWTRPRPGPPQEPHAHRLRARPFPPLSRSGPADHNS